MTDPSTISQADTIAAVRRFSRFYTRQPGLLGEGLLNSDFSLTEARVLYELAHRDGAIAADIRRDPGIDAGYLSRILKTFELRVLIARTASSDDGRRTRLNLTQTGWGAFEMLDRASQEEVRAIIGKLCPAQAVVLTEAMRTIEDLIGSRSPMAAPIILRSYRIGDLGWIVHRQAILYAREYGWDATYEPLAAEILAGFVKRHDPERERGWIADSEGQVLGSVFVMRGSDAVAKLRLLYVEPAARGLGLGRRLVDECVAFAREKEYRILTLWTNDVLVPARRIYQQAGFGCVAAEAHHSFGKDLVGEMWELAL